MSIGKEAPLLSEGTLLGGRFRVVSPLGRGAFGSVYACEDLLRGDRAAVKILHRPHGRPLGRFYMEFRALQGLNHPGVVAARTFARHGGFPFIAMDLVAGRPLNQALAPLPAPLPRVVAVLRQALDALATVHDRGLVHRDLKPANMLLSEGDRLSILDFGAVLLADGDETSLFLEGGAVGTLAYMAPEVMRGQSLDGRTDLYSLGVIAYELLTGRLPHRVTGSAPAAMLQILKSVAAPVASFRPTLPRALAEVVDRLLERQPSDRFPSATAVLDAMQEGGLIRTSVRATQHPRSSPAAPGEELPLLGREEAMQAVDFAAAQAESGRGTLLGVGGEMGCGLTRFLKEARVRLLERGWLVVPSRPEEWTHPGAPGQALATRELCAFLGTSGERFGPLVSALLDPDPASISTILPLGADDLRHRRLQGLHGWLRLLQAASQQAPVAVVLEDQDRLDRAGRPLATWLCDNVREMEGRILVLAGGIPARDIELRRLAPVEVEALFPERGDLGMDDARAARELFERTRGVPALLAATLQHWARTDLVQAVPGGFTVSRAGREAFAQPEGLDDPAAELTESRYHDVLDWASSEARRLLAVACLVDLPGSLSLLARASGVDEWEVLAPLEELVNLDLMRQEGGFRLFVPVHPALEALVQDEMSAQERVTVHLRVAKALREEGGRDADIARHLEAAGQEKEAAELYLRASLQALSAHDVDGSLEWASRATGLGDDPLLHWRAHLLRGRGARLTGEVAVVRESSEALLRPPPGIPAAERVEGALLVAAQAMDSGQSQRAEEALEGAEQAAGEAPGLKAEVHLRRAQWLIRSGRGIGGEEEARQALLGFRRAEIPRGAARALHTLSAAVYSRGDYGGSAALAREAVSTFTEPQDRADAAHSWYQLGIALAGEGEEERAGEALAEARDRFAEAGNLRALAYARLAALDLACRSGEPPLALAQDVLRFTTRLGLPELEAYAHLSLAAAGGIDGSASSAVRSARRAVDLYQRIGNQVYAGFAFARLALAERRRDREPAADDASARAVALLDEAAPPDLRWQVQVVRARCAADGEVRAEAARKAGEGALQALQRLAGDDPEGREREMKRRRDLCTLRDALEIAGLSVQGSRSAR